MSNTEYPIINSASGGVGGIVDLKMMPNGGEGIPPHFMGYISVNDVDATCGLVKENGGKILMGPENIPHVGRFAVIEDPQGRQVTAFRSAEPDRAEVERPMVGDFCWDQLNTNDLAGSIAFYTAAFGYGTESFGTDDTITTLTSGGKQRGSIMAAPQGVPTHWFTYIVMPTSVPESRDRAMRLGSTIHLEEVVVPNVGRFAAIADPTGAVAGIFEPASR